MGDLNATVGNEAVDNLVGAYDLGDRNDIGKCLIELCQEHNVVITNTWFNMHLEDYSHGKTRRPIPKSDRLHSHKPWIQK